MLVFGQWHVKSLYHTCFKLRAPPSEYKNYGTGNTAFSHDIIALIFVKFMVIKLQRRSFILFDTNPTFPLNRKTFPCIPFTKAYPFPFAP